MIKIIKRVKNVNENGEISSFSSLDNTPGMGNVVPSSVKEMGSGDNFGLLNKRIKKINKVAESLNEFLNEEKKLNKDQKRGDVVFPYDSPKVTDNADHFPINTISQARNALARVAQYKKVPTWYKGTLSDVQEKVKKAVHKKYPSIDIDGEKEKDKKVSESINECFRRRFKRK